MKSIAKSLLCGSDGIWVLGAAASLALLAAPAAASVTISSAATKNMNCSAGVCSPTKTTAVLNVSDLEHMLKSGNVTVTTTGSGTVQANNIVVSAALTWSSASGLTLTANKSVSFDAAVSVTGKGGLALNNAGTVKSLAFYNGGNVTFANLSGSLVINGNTYTLVGTVADLANAVAANNTGNFALAANYDASGDGTYPDAPIQPDMDGVFEGLGNTISNVTISDSAQEDPLDGFFRTLNGSARDFGLVDISVSNAPSQGGAGAGTIAANFGGTIWRCWATGAVSDGSNGSAGGMVAGSGGGSIIQSWTNVAVTTNGSAAGGIAGFAGNGNFNGLIEQSFAIGSVTSVSDNVALGGLVGVNNAQIKQSYSTATITMNYSSNSNSVLGGLIGAQDCCTAVHPGLSETYSTGAITAPASSCTGTNCIGGWIGYDNAGGQTPYAHNYWDRDTSNVPNKSQGAGNIPNDPGVAGLSTTTFTAGLPKGFSAKVWAENPNINGGYPYLRANPPPN